MKYLVLKQFTSYGRLFLRGETVDGSEIRTPSLRQSEGKIVPAVPSFEVPEEIVSEQAPPQDISDGDDDKSDIAPKKTFGLFLKKE